MEPTFEPGMDVFHERFGQGTVRADMGPTALVRFEHGVEECEKIHLQRIPSLTDRVRRPSWDVPLEVINRIQAEAILSVNDTWGVFGRSRIELLPHQLWVCREVTRDWPARWLVADDVGLGKTIEAGMILTSLLSRERVKRFLVICPASLVAQWQRRLRVMFDIRMAIYTTAADTPHTDFWHTHSQVVVSMHTLRADRHGKHERLLEADPWDLVLVDESHHLNADEKTGPTLAYQLVKKMSDHDRIRSMVFFTGTPHRGKTFGFLAQLQLLRPDLFDPKKPLRGQLPNLREVVIRNNKLNVTDLKGERLFQDPIVEMATYQYAEIEQLFYDTLSEFIVKGRAYAARLNKADATAVVLVLIAMQKLASSSVAAIRRAIRGRLNRIMEGRDQVAELKKRIDSYQNLLDEDANDLIAGAEEDLAEASASLVLMEDEEPSLRQLLEIADEISDETKISRLLEVLEERYSDRAVLFFTEYKATQSLLMSALIQRYGDDCVTFINGDNRAEQVRMSDGRVTTKSTPRESAADEFNAGKVRFLVSTEAAAEGIDLQESCHTLIHVDLPWNPMRLHQRVGRLNRFGQKKRVEVLSIRNPDTVEAHIWSKLEEKIERINEAFAHVMDTPEDLRQLVLGVTSPRFFQGLFADSVETSREQLSDWFDERTASFGGKDAVEVVEALVGGVHRFDFHQVSDRLPKVDLPDLQDFFEVSLGLNGRRLISDDHGFSFITPEAWRGTPAVRTRYGDMVFDRGGVSSESAQRLLGIGHRVIDEALAQAKNREASVATLDSSLLPHPLVVFRVRDKVTERSNLPAEICGMFMPIGLEEAVFLPDWRVLLTLNELPSRRETMRDSSAPIPEAEVVELIEKAKEVLHGKLGEIGRRFRIPEVHPIAVLWPL